MTCKPHWDDTPSNPVFCEYYVWENQWVSTFTSLMYTVLAIYGLYATQCKGKITKLIFSTMAFLGVGSALYHYNSYTLFARFDVFPIILILYYLILFTTDSLVYNLVPKFYEFLSAIVYCMYTPIYVLIMASTTVKLFDINTNEVIICMAVVELVILLAFVLSEWKNDAKIVVPYLVTSFILFAIATTIWFAVEEECNDITKYTFAHGIWHILTAFGLLYITLSIHLIRHSGKWCHTDKLRSTLLERVFPRIIM